MATIGQQLTAPEAGWKRYDDLDSNISYLGSGWFNDTTYTPYLGSRKGIKDATTPEYSIRFNFTGSNLRIIGALSSNWSNNVQISVDGIIETFSQYSTTVTGQILNYEKLNLDNGEHSVIMTNTGSGYWALDAVDIDETGELKPYDSSCLLRVTMLDSSERDYQLSTTEIDGFVNWFNSHTSTNTTSYMLNKKVGTQNSKEYLSFDKIISFEVIELK